MKKKPIEKKLSLNKMKISKITNLQVIKGGEDLLLKTDPQCAFPDNASKPPQGPIKV